MRKITQEVCEAFIKGIKKSISNTSTDGTSLYLHGNTIAYKDEAKDNSFFITSAGWMSNTTKERLNGLPGVQIAQKKGVWYLNGEKWDGFPIKIK